MIRLTSSGSYRSTEDWLRGLQEKSIFASLEKYGPIGVDALKAATPQDDGDTASHWDYEIVSRPGYYSIKWTNDDVVEPGHIPIAVLIQYGHGTREGGYVEGIDYINPAMRPIFDQIVSDMWKEVTRGNH
jgi:hypothetical protein